MAAHMGEVDQVREEHRRVRIGRAGRFALSLMFLIVIAHRTVLYADDTVRLMVGRSAVINPGSAIARVSLTSADVADALVTSSSELLINGKMPGTISMFVWDRAGGIKRYEIIVQRDLARLSEQIKELFPTESIEVQANGRNIVLSGTVTNKDVVERAVNLASGYVDKKDEVVTLLKLQEGAPTNQVLLRVRFAEVSRTAMTELGVGFFTSPTGINNNIARVTTTQVPTPTFTDQAWTKASTSAGADVTAASGKFSIGDFLNLFFFNSKYDIGAVVKALQTKGLFQSLAEPNLVAESGKEASFLAGGEFPIPVAQGSGANLAISVQFKEFGVRLGFTPTVVGNRVHLKVKPEVSTLDFANAVQLNGFRIPALSTRRTETELELNNGQTFAIAGLLNNSMTNTLQKIPGIGDIPILGLLFKSKAAQKERTELVVIITPEILPNNSKGVTSELPRMEEQFLPALPDKKSVPMPPAAFPPAGRPSSDNDGAAAAAAKVTVPQPAIATREADPSAAAAAATMRGLTPSAAAPQLQKAQPVQANSAPVNPTSLPADASAPAAAPTTAASRPMTADEKRAMEKAAKQEHDQAEAAKAVDGKARAKQIEEEKKAEEKAAKAAAEQAKRQAEIQKNADEAAAKRSAEQAKKQAEIDKKLQAAQKEYDAEVAKIKKQ
jgi:pilus assembly protein CpaC